MTNSTYSGDCPNVSIRNPNGTTLASTTICGGSSSSLSNETLPTTGTYTVLVNPGVATGGYTYTLTQNITQSLPFNSPLTVSSALAGQSFDLTFSGTAAQQVVSLVITNNSYPCGGPPLFYGNLNVSILKPDGTTLVSDNALCGSDSLNNVNLPTTGTYTVLVNPGATTGGVTFTLTPNITEPIVFNTPLSVSSSLAGQVFDLTFSGTAAQVVSLVITNNSYPCGGPPLFYGNLNVSILKPDGTTLVSDNALCGSDSLNNVNLPTTGTYTVLVNPGATTGGVTFTLTPNITEPIVFNTPLSVSSSLAGQVFDLTFSGTAAQVVSLVITNNSYPCGGPPLFYGNLNVSILKPDGTTLVSDNALCGSDSLNNV